jgi:signal transduction histidine kinase
MPPLQTVPLEGMRALLVEDDTAIRDVLQQMLTDEGMLLTSFPNGLEALTYLKNAPPPDVIILDLMMPVMDGWQFRLEQKKDPILESIPVVAMSADGSAKAEAIDADAYVRKPVDFDLLLKRIVSVIQGARRQRLAAANRLAALGTLAAGIAHEVNNPLTYIMANLQYLLDRMPALAVGPAAKEASEILADTLDGTRRIAKIVNQAQLVAPTATGDSEALLDLRAALEASVDRLQTQMRRRAVLTTTYDGRPSVRGDRGRLEQLFTNLLLNAMQAIPEGKPRENRINVTLYALSQGQAVVEISDTGVGISPDVQERIFQPFFTTKPVGQGAGLGLAICQGIVSALGGDITFETEVGRGSSFRVNLPALPSVQEPAPVQRSAPAPRLPAGSRVLVIDDDPLMLRACRYILGPDYEVSFAQGEQAGMRLLAEEPPFEMILCELMLEEASGMDLATRLETDRPDLARRLIFMTGGALTPAAQTLIDSKRYPCISKPFDRDHLIAAMAARGVPAPPVIRPKWPPSALSARPR